MYQNKLLESGQISKEDIERINNKVASILNEEFNNSKDYVPKKRDWLSAYWTGFKSPEQISRIRNTGYENSFSEFHLFTHVAPFLFFLVKLSCFQSQSRSTEKCWKSHHNHS